MNSLAFNVGCKQVCDNMLKTLRKQLYKSSTCSVSLPFLEAMGRLNHDEKPIMGYLDIKKEINPPTNECTYFLKHVKHVYAIAQIQGNEL